jgi:hypothetical protein
MGADVDEHAVGTRSITVLNNVFVIYTTGLRTMIFGKILWCPNKEKICE